MNYKLAFKIFFLIFIIISKVNSNEIKFDSNNIKILENGNIITALNVKAFIPEEKIEIEGDKSIYNKTLSELTVEKNVKFFDKIKNVYLEGEKVIYDKLSNILYSEGKTFLKIENTYEIFSKNLYYDRNLMRLYTNKETIIEDVNRNIFDLEQGFNFDINKEIITSKHTKIIDVDNNNYFFENAKINLLTNEIVGKEVRVDFIDSFFGNENNDPILKGKSTVSNDKETKIYKAVFSTCNTENQNCRGWELESDEFTHNKIERLFEYKDSWLKVFGKKIFFFPFFSHPDPTVNRKSGFLTPTYGSSENLGTWVTVPYFKVISNAKDMTFKPRIFADDNFIFQAEYREAFENSNLITDFSFQKGSNSTNTHLFGKINGDLDDKTDYEFQIQNVTNNNYLKKYNLSTSSPLITNESLLVNNFNFNKNIDEDTSISTSFKVFEDLSKNNSDKYQYIFPNFNFVKYLNINENYNGNFKFVSSGFQKNYDTNKYEVIINNDFIFESNNIINSLGIVNNYDLLLKSFNSYAEKSTNYSEKNDHEVYGKLKFNSSFPLKKRNKNSTNYLKPIISAMYSPNGTKDISDNGTILNYDNIFNFNRIGNSEMVEGGKSLSLGIEFEKQNQNYEKIFSFNIANVIRDKENFNLPSKSKLGKTRSDIIGKLTYKPNEIIDLGYQFSYDRDLDFSNYDSVQSIITLGKFVTEFNYITENHELGDLEVLSNQSSYKINKTSNLGFKTNKDLKNDFTEYYNLIYEYETDCLNASIQYNKKFYRNGDLIPDESVNFIVRFIPFAEIRSSIQDIQEIK